MLSLLSRPRGNTVCFRAGAVLFTTIVAVMILRDSLQAQDRMTSLEERTIRHTYMKLMLLDRVARRHSALRKGEDVPTSLGLDLKLGDFKSGPIADIYDQRLVELSTLPTGEILRVSAQIIKDSPSSDETVAYQARWVPGSYSTSVDPESMTVREALSQMGPDYADIGKYTAFEVTAALDGKVRTYRALVLYHSGLESSPEARMEYWDAVVGMGGTLNDVARETRRPHSSARKLNPASESEGAVGKDVDRPLGGPAISQTFGWCDGHYPICCPVWATAMDECCWDESYGWGNPTAMPSCRELPPEDGGGGGGGGDPTPAERCNERFWTGTGVNQESSDAQGHSDGYKLECGVVGGNVICYTIPQLAGMHLAATNVHGECIIYSDCKKRCNVVVDNSHIRDWGHTTILYHVVKERAHENNDGTGGATSDVSCVGGVGYAVEQCLTPYCSVSLSVSATLSQNGAGIGGGLSVQSSALWTAAHGLTHTCSNPPPQ